MPDHHTSAATHDAGARPTRVLVACDDLVQRHLTDNLKADGFDVVGDPRPWVTRAVATSPDVDIAVVDLDMPADRVAAVCAALATRNTPAIGLRIPDDRDLPDSFHTHNASTLVVSKPFSYPQVRGLVARLLATSPPRCTSKSATPPAPRSR